MNTIFYQIKHRGRITFFVAGACLVFFNLSVVPLAAAFTQSDFESLQNFTPFYNTAATSCPTSGVTTTVSSNLPSFIPSPYRDAFAKGANAHSVAPALVAAIFTEEHFTGTQPSTLPGIWTNFPKVHPNPNGGWNSSGAGAQGPFQFLTATWATYGEDGNNDGVKDIQNIWDAAAGAAHLLGANGATINDSMASWQKAIWDYNHADWYVNAVLTYYRFYTTGNTSNVTPPQVNTTTSCSTVTTTSAGSYKNPFRAVKGLRPERVDQGVDYGGSGPVYALGDGVIVNLTNPGWSYGGYDAFLTERLTDGPAKGYYVYMAEACVPVQGIFIGKKVTPDTVICNMINPTSSGIETGWAEPPGNGNPYGQNIYNESVSTVWGVNYEQLLVKLGAPKVTILPTVVGTLPASWPRWTNTPPGTL